jgi:hypothetical protein
MSLVPLLSVGFALAICATPVVLLRRPGRRGLPSDGVDEPVPPAVVRNAWIAYALRVSVLLPLFVLGAAGDVWPAIAGSVGFGAGICLLGAWRQPIAAFVDEARRQGRPGTLHALLAQACAGAVSIRLASASATVVALLGLAGAEAAALVVVMMPLVGEGVGIPCFVILVLAAGLYAVSVGTNGMRYAAQALLGAIYIGVFGSAAFLLYLNATDLRPMPPHGAFALIVLALSCVAILAYRQTKYIETPHLVAATEPSRWRRALARQVRLVQRFANVCISVLAVLIVVLAAMQFYFLGFPGTVRDGFAALGMAPHIPAIGMVGIALLALAYPLVDAVSWQCAGALAASARATGTRPAQFLRPTRMVAGESAMIAVVAAAYGAIAVLATDLPSDSTGITDFVRQLMSFDHEITDAALALLLVGCFAMAASTMGMAASTAMTVIRLDILPAVRPGNGDAVEAGPVDRAAVVLVSAVAAAVAAVWIVSGVPAAGIADARFFAVALAFACLQMSLLPLLLARLGGLALPGAAALAVVAAGAGASLGSIVIYGASGDILWLWLAIPACLLPGLLLLAAAAFRGRAITPAG